MHLAINLVGGDTVSVANLGPTDGTFFGFTSSQPFTSFTITAGPFSGNAETFDMDNLQFAPAAVPEPATFLVFGVGLAGLAAYRLKRRKVVLA